MEAMDEIDTLQSKTDSCLVIDGESLQVNKISLVRGQRDTDFLSEIAVS
jgi:hypothetical protein